MADTLVKAKNDLAVWNMIWKRLRQGASDTTVTKLKHPPAQTKKRCWVAATADPYVDAGSQGDYPVEIGDVAYRVDTDEAFICSVAPAANTDSTFIQMHA